MDTKSSSHSNPPNAGAIRAAIRAFEDRKISAADLVREVYHLARSIHDESQSGLRRALERHGNRIAVLIERGPGTQMRGEILEVLDEMIADLAGWGY